MPSFEEDDSVSALSESTTKAEEVAHDPPASHAEPQSSEGAAVHTDPKAASALFGPMYADTTATTKDAPKAAPKAAPVASEGAPEKKPVPADDMTAKQVQAAVGWAAAEKLDPGAIEQLQGAVGAEATGVYDEATAHYVYQRQRKWQPKGAIAGAGQANAGVFRRLGLVYTKEIKNATVSDAAAAQIQQQCPGGVTVAIYPNFKNKSGNNMEFQAQARIFSQNHNAVGLSGGGVVLGAPVMIDTLGDVIGAVQGIHRGLLAMHKKGQPAGAAVDEAPPAWTQVKNLALFAHGEPWGMGMNGDNDFSGDGIHNTQRGLNPPNVKSFVKGLSGAVAGDVRVSLFACSAGRDNHKEEYNDWQGHKQNDRTGKTSLAASMAEELGPQASVWAHTTAGHTTENFAMRVYGADSGAAASEGGLQGMDIVYPETFIQSELARIHTKATDAQKPKLHDSLREEMWKHFQDSITGEHGRSASKKRYKIPMGQELFTNPDNARALMQADWQTNWAPSHVKPVS